MALFLNYASHIKLRIGCEKLAFLLDPMAFKWIAPTMKTSFLHLAGIQMLNGKSWESDTLLRVGRIAGVELVLDDASVSRRHAEVAWTNLGWIVRDLGSTNGTYINGLRIGRVDRQIQQGDLLRFGNLSVMVGQLGTEAENPVSQSDSSSEIPLPLSEHRLKRNSIAEAGNAPRAHELPATRTRLWSSSIWTMKDLLTSIVQNAAEALGAATAFISLKDPANRRLMLRVGVGMEIESEHRAPTFDLADKAFRAGESLLFNVSRFEAPQAVEIRQFPSAVSALIRFNNENLGILQVMRTSDSAEYNEQDLFIADTLASEAGSQIQSIEVAQNQQQHLIISSVIALAQAVELRDEYTGGHTQRVTDYALLLADEMKLSQKERYYLQVGAPLHDLGMIGIADKVLCKPGRLTNSEFETMKGHTVRGANIIETIPELSPILTIVRNHHERWDGKGYPDGLAGEAIPLLARLLTVVDTFDAMTTDRPYRPALTVEKAFAELRAGAGTQFDPECVEAFCRVRPRIEKIILENSTAVKPLRPKDQPSMRKEKSPGHAVLATLRAQNLPKNPLETIRTS